MSVEAMLVRVFTHECLEAKRSDLAQIAVLPWILSITCVVPFPARGTGTTIGVLRVRPT